MIMHIASMTRHCDVDKGYGTQGLKGEPKESDTKDSCLASMHVGTCNSWNSLAQAAVPRVVVGHGVAIVLNEANFWSGKAHTPRWKNILHIN